MGSISAGVAQVRECLGLLRSSGYAGWLSIEVGIGPPLAEAVHAAGALAEMWRGG